MSDGSGHELTRRHVLAGAGAAVAGIGLAAAPVAHAEFPDRIALGQSGATVVEFRGRISQTGSSGETFSSLGFLTRVAGLSQDIVFAGSATTVGTALFSAVASGELTARVLDQQVHALDIVGEMRVYHLKAPGLDFTVPASFTAGTLVATYDLLLQDVLAVIDTGKGVPTLSGDMTQTDARSVAKGLQFGHRGQRLRLFATGVGHLVDPVTLNADLEVAGNWSIV